MLDPQLPAALGVVAGAAGLLLRGPVGALVRSRRPASAPPAKLGGCHGCPAGGSCTKQSC